MCNINWILINNKYYMYDNAMSIRYIYTFHTKFQLNSWNKGIQRTKIIMGITFFHSNCVDSQRSRHSIWWHLIFRMCLYIPDRHTMSLPWIWLFYVYIHKIHAIDCANVMQNRSSDHCVWATQSLWLYSMSRLICMHIYMQT